MYVHISTQVFSHLQLIGGPKFFPILFRHQRFYLVAGQVDSVVEVSAPEYVIVTPEVPVGVKMCKDLRIVIAAWKFKLKKKMFISSILLPLYDGSSGSVVKYMTYLI